MPLLESFGAAAEKDKILLEQDAFALVPQLDVAVVADSPCWGNAGEMSVQLALTAIPAHLEASGSDLHEKAPTLVNRSNTVRAADHISPLNGRPVASWR